MATSKMKQTGGKDSSNQQAKTIVNQVNIALAPLDEMAKVVLENAFGGVPSATLKQVEENQSSFKSIFVDELKKIVAQVNDIEKIVSSPDFQYISKKVLLSASRSDRADMHQDLSHLVVQRMLHDKSDIKRIVFNEAIEVINKLTDNQLKILSLCFLGKYVIWTDILTKEQLNNVLNKFFVPLLEVELTNSQFQYLEYVGCSNNSSMGGKNHFKQFVKRKYPMSLSKGMDAEDIDNFKDYELIKVGEKYKIPYVNLEIMKTSLSEKGFSEEKIQQYVNLYNQMVGKRVLNSDDDIPSLFTKGSELDEVYSWFGTMNLTAVGIAIAITHLEKVVGEKWDVDIWIN